MRPKGRGKSPFARLGTSTRWDPRLASPDHGAVLGVCKQVVRERYDAGRGGKHETRGRQLPSGLARPAFLPLPSRRGHDEREGSGGSIE